MYPVPIPPIVPGMDYPPPMPGFMQPVPPPYPQGQITQTSEWTCLVPRLSWMSGEAGNKTIRYELHFDWLIRACTYAESPEHEASPVYMLMTLLNADTRYHYDWQGYPPWRLRPYQQWMQTTQTCISQSLWKSFYLTSNGWWQTRFSSFRSCFTLLLNFTFIYAFLCTAEVQ